MKKASALVITLMVFILLSGCAAGTASANSAVQTNQVTMPPSYRFDPPVIQIKAGDTVTWTNKDNFTHDVHLLGSINWHSQPLRPGDSVSYTFKDPGEYPYTCDFHSRDMKGTVIVVQR